jgi:hypothetical protein
MDYNPFLVNGRKYKEYSRGALLVADKGAITERGFNYAVRTPRAYTATIAGIPTEYDKPSEIIFTSRLDLPFARGARVRLNDGRVLTVKDTAFEYDNNRAYANGDGRVGWLLILEGGH